MKPIARDYQAPENDLVTIEDGTYSIESVDFMTKSIDEATKKPKLIDGNFGPVIMFDLSIVGSEDTVPLSCRLNEIPYLVQAFTGKAGDLLPPVPALDQLAAIEAYLMLAVQKSNEGTQRPTIVVKKGWGSVYRMSNSGISKGIYHGYFTDILSKNSLGLPAPKASDQFPDSYTYDGLFLIVADQYGEPFGWSGATHYQRFLPYKATTITDEHGQIRADWIRGKKTGEYTKTAKDFSIFVGTTAPSLFPPPPDEPRFADPSNICPEWIMAAQRDRVLLIFQIEINDAGYRVIDISGILPADPTRVKIQVAPAAQIPQAPRTSPPPPPPSPPSVNNGTTPQQGQRQAPTAVGPMIDDLPSRHIQVLTELLNLLLLQDTSYDGPPFAVPFPKPNMLTPGQKNVIMTYIAPLKDHLSSSDLNRFTLADIGFIFEGLPFENFEDTLTSQISTLFQKLETESTPENFF